MPIPDEFDYEYEYQGGSPLKELFINMQGSRNHLDKHPTDKSQIGHAQSPMIAYNPGKEKEQSRTQKTSMPRKRGFGRGLDSKGSSSLSALLHSENLGQKTLKEADSEICVPHSVTVSNKEQYNSTGKLV